MRFRASVPRGLRSPRPPSWAGDLPSPHPGERVSRASGTRKLAVSALVVVLALVAAACGSSSKSGVSAGTTGTTATPATGTPLKIGWIGTLTSTSGVNYQGGKDTLDSWVKTTNAAGEISGHPVTAVYADDKGDPAVGLAAVKDLVENQHLI